jgi:hypothetical protein
MNTRRARKNLLACYSFRGHDFEVIGRWAKKVTNRARRALDKAVCREVD